LVTRFCEGCGHRFDLPGPEPGELGLDRVARQFRCCPGCGRFVGISCCWDQQLVACASCVAAGSATPNVARPSDVKATGPFARRALANLSSSVLAVQRLAEDPKAMRVGMLTLAHWEDSWWQTAWLVVRTETSTDAATAALSLVRGGGSRRLALVAEFEGLVDAYGKARATVDERLVASGRPHRESARHPPQPLRGPRLAAITAVFVTLLTISTALAAGALLGGGLNQAAQPEGSVLGASIAPKGTPAVPPSAHTTQLVAQLDFDTLRIGALNGAGADLGEVTGAAVVASFPSPFDRSARLSGSGPNGFCLHAPLSPGAMSTTLDLYAASPSAAGSLQLIVNTADGSSRMATIPARLLQRLLPEHWYRIEATWQAANLVLEVSPPDENPVLIESLLVANGTRRSGNGFCLSAIGMPAQQQLFIDNVRVER
jgi:hypothetical protein